MSFRCRKDFSKNLATLRASMQPQTDSATNFKMRDILSELDRLFTDAIRQVNVVFILQIKYNV